MTQTPTRTSSRAALVLVLALAAGAAACDRKDGGAESAGAAAETDASRPAAETGSAAAGGSAVAGGPTAEAPTSADSAALRSYTLTMDKVDGFFKANLNLARAVKADTALRARTHVSGGESFERVAARFESEPAVRKAIEEAGLSPREFTLTMYSLFQAAFANSAMQEQRIGADSAAKLAGINPANIAFVREHQQELAQRQQRMEEEMRALAAE